MPSCSSASLWAILIAASRVRCWTFTSMRSGDNKMIDPWNAEEGGIYPIPYEKIDRNAIDEDNPPDPPEERVSFTFPGTKWCGPGNVAESYHDLGEKNETDRCCRRHDYCDDIIPAGHTAHGLVNDEFYTKLHCDCDREFYDCLKRADDGIQGVMGKIYFNAIGTQCFRLDFPVARCVKYRGVIRRKCVEYEYDTSREQVYQWFDVPPF